MFIGVDIGTSAVKIVLVDEQESVVADAELAALGLDLQRRTGVLPMPGFTGPKLLWLARNEPEPFARTRFLLLAKDYIRLKLSGERATDVSDAAGTWLLDQYARDWCAETVAACGASPALLPRLVESPDATGTLRDELAARWGLPKGVVIAGGAGDVAAGGVGIGAVNPGDAFISLGTSAQVFVADDAHRPEPELLVHAFAHALPARWFRMAALLNGASPLAAATHWTGETSVGTLLAEMEAAYKGPSKLLALPYFSGERTPHNNPLARGAIVGLDAATTRADVTQAIAEAIAFSLADGLGVLGRPPERLALIGGGARSSFWGKLIASVLGVQLVRYHSSERGPAFGAARLGRLAAGSETPESVVVAPSIAETIDPDLAWHEAYRPRVEAFRVLYRSLQPVWPSVTL